MPEQQVAVSGQELSTCADAMAPAARPGCRGDAGGKGAGSNGLSPRFTDKATSMLRRLTSTLFRGGAAPSDSTRLAFEVS